MRQTIYRNNEGYLNASEGAAHVIDHSEAVPRYLVTPEIAGTPVPDKLVDGVGTASLIPYYLRATIMTNGGGDDVTAAFRLQNGYPDVKICYPGGDEIEFDVSNDRLDDGSPVNILRVYWIVVGNTSAGPLTAAPANYTGNESIIASTETDAADWQAQMIRDVYSADDAVRKVRISMSDILATNFAYVHREGTSYA